MDSPKNGLPSISPLAHSPSDLSRLLGISVCHLRRLESAGKIPKPVRLGRLLRWPASEIEQWLAEGSPDRKAWEARKRAYRRRTRRA